MKYFQENALHTIDLEAEDHLVNPYPKGFSKVNLTPGTSNNWSVQRFMITRDEVGMYNLRLIRDGRRDRVVPPGEYTRLVRDEVSTVMSDTPAEAHEHAELYAAAKGHVLINGLGIGFGLKAVLSKPLVKSVIVVEKSSDVIKLVGSQITDPRVTIIQDDAFEYKPTGRYDVVWHDIWDDICEDNLSEIRRLRRKYAKRTMWQGAWSEKYL